MKLLKLVLVLLAVLVVSAASVDGKHGETRSATFRLGVKPVDAHQEHRLALRTHAGAQIRAQHEVEDIFSDTCTAIRNGAKTLKKVAIATVQTCKAATVSVVDEIAEAWKVTKDGAMALKDFIANNVEMGFELKYPTTFPPDQDLEVGVSLKFPNAGIDVVFPAIKKILSEAKIEVGIDGAVIGIPGSLKASMKLIKPMEFGVGWSAGLPVVKKGGDDGWEISVFKKEVGGFEMELKLTVLWEFKTDVDIKTLGTLQAFKDALKTSEIQVGVQFEAKHKTTNNLSIKPTLTSPKVELGKIAAALFG